jgi:hypothetical protein
MTSDSQPRRRSRLFDSAAALVMLAIGSLLAFSTLTATIEALAPLHGQVVDHGPSSRTHACYVVVRLQNGKRRSIGSDREGCNALPIGAMVSKDAWSLTYRAEHGGLWREDPVAFCLGGVFGSLFMIAWVAGVLYLLVKVWRPHPRERPTS